jgi:hypothetical protein
LKYFVTIWRRFDITGKHFFCRLCVWGWYCLLRVQIAGKFMQKRQENIMKIVNALIIGASLALCAQWTLAAEPVATKTQERVKTQEQNQLHAEGAEATRAQKREGSGQGEAGYGQGYESRSGNGQGKGSGQGKGKGDGGGRH